ncbi:MAG TPA: GntR family transcriptional regulator [Clostridiales bacterium]|nr:GntR family transcriptional regulator [Clostridiales bacterium]
MKKVPKYKAVKDFIEKGIAAGEYLPGDKLPNENELTEMLGVSSITVKKAMAELVNEGVISRIPGKGSFVNEIRNNAAQSSQKLIAFLLSCQDVNDSSCMQIMMGVQSCLASGGYSMIVEHPGDDPDRELQIIMRLLDNHVAGFILFSANPERSIDNYIYLRNKNIPYVLLDRWVDYLPANSVACNNHDGAFSAVEYLIELGHRKIGFVADNFYLSSEKERYRGYCNALKMASIPVEKRIVFCDPESDYSRIMEAVKNKELTALFAVNDRKGLELLNMLLDNGISIPDDVSIMGFDDYEASKYARIPLSTVRQHFEREGYIAAQILLDTIKGYKTRYNKILVGTEIVIRSSTEALRKNRT